MALQIRFLLVVHDPGYFLHIGMPRRRFRHGFWSVLIYCGRNRSGFGLAYNGRSRDSLSS
jgi:hypothetical protein